jgi:hypothetical protein
MKKLRKGYHEEAVAKLFRYGDLDLGGISELAYQSTE